MKSTTTTKFGAITKFKVEQGIPPTPRGGAKRIYPFGEMNVGDSFLVPPDKEGTLRSAASYWGTRHKQKFVVRKSVNGEVGVRCWRVK